MIQSNLSEATCVFRRTEPESVLCTAEPSRPRAHAGSSGQTPQAPISAPGPQPLVLLQGGPLLRLALHHVTYRGSFPTTGQAMPSQRKMWAGKGGAEGGHWPHQWAVSLNHLLRGQLLPAWTLLPI